MMGLILRNIQLSCREHRAGERMRNVDIPSRHSVLAITNSVTD